MANGSLLPISTQTKQDPREPVLMMAFMIKSGDCAFACFCWNVYFLVKRILFRNNVSRVPILLASIFICC